MTHFILEEPPTRVGICCGEGCQEYSLLFKITGLYRYRCAECYTKETGHRPPNEPVRLYTHVETLRPKTRRTKP